MSWSGDGGCNECATGSGHAPTIGLVCCIFIAVGLLVACVSKKCRYRKADAPSAFFSEAKTLYLLFEVKGFTLFLAAQVLEPHVLSIIYAEASCCLFLGCIAIRNHLEYQG